MTDLTKVCIINDVFNSTECDTIINYSLRAINSLTNDNYTFNVIHNYKHIALPINEYTVSLQTRIYNYMKHFIFLKQI